MHVSFAALMLKNRLFQQIHDVYDGLPQGTVPRNVQDVRAVLSHPRVLRQGYGYSVYVH